MTAAACAWHALPFVLAAGNTAAMSDSTPADESPVEMVEPRLEDAIAAGRARELLEWAMRGLAPEDRLVLILLEIEERPVREIAAETGWSESKVKVRAFRARARLKEILNRSN